MATCLLFRAYYNLGLLLIADCFRLLATVIATFLVYMLLKLLYIKQNGDFYPMLAV